MGKRFRAILVTAITLVLIPLIVQFFYDSWAKQNLPSIAADVLTYKPLPALIALAFLILLFLMAIWPQRFGGDRPGGGSGDRQPPMPPNDSPAPGAVRLRYELAEQLQVLRHFRAEFEQIMGQEPPKPEDAITLDLAQIASRQLQDIPLRSYELSAILYVLREAIENVDDLPFETGLDATDIKKRAGAKRSDVEVWYLPLKTAKAYGNGELRSDETLSTLTELHGRILALRKEVWRRYHPPSITP